jgi:hypothetical protein
MSNAVSSNVKAAMVLALPFWLWQMLRYGKYRAGFGERWGRVQPTKTTTSFGCSTLCLRWCRILPNSQVGLEAIMTHAPLWALIALLCSVLDANVTLGRAARTEARVITCGHTHLPEVRDLGWKMIVGGRSGRGCCALSTQPAGRLSVIAPCSASV